jgi:hypothetical protein
MVYPTMTASSWSEARIILSYSILVSRNDQDASIRKHYFPNPDREEWVKYCEYWQGKLSDSKDIDFPHRLCTAIADITDGFSFAYMQKAFVAALLVIAAGKDEPAASGWNQRRRIKMWKDSSASIVDSASPNGAPIAISIKTSYCQRSSYRSRSYEKVSKERNPLHSPNSVMSLVTKERSASHRRSPVTSTIKGPCQMPLH